MTLFMEKRSEAHVFATIESDECLLIDVLVASLNEVGFCLEVIILRLVELGNGSLTVLILCLCEVKGVIGGSDSLLRGLLLGLGIERVIIYLLYILIERLLRIVERQLLVLLIDTGSADTVARLEAVEDRHIKVQTDILREVILQLGTETIGLEAGSGVVIGTQTTTERERGIVTSLMPRASA